MRVTSHAALITATIAPQIEMSHLVVRDPGARLAQYEAALRVLVHASPFDRIVFAENSGFLETAMGRSLIDRYRLSVEFVSIDVTDQPPRLGKGRQEGFTIARAIVQSSLESASTVTKLSGRYALMNPRSYLAGVVNAQSSILCHLWHNLSFADTRAFTFAPELFAAEIEPFMSEINDDQGVYFEHCVANGVHRILSKGQGGWSLPPVRARLHGQSGSLGGKAPTILGDAVKDLSHRLLRRFVEGR